MSVWIETLGMVLVLFAQIYRTKYGARIEIFLVFHQDLSLISHVIERAWIEITQVQDTGTKTKGGRNAQTIEILLRADHR